MSHVPSSLKYTKTHEWVNTDTDVGRMGITEYAQHLLGDLVFVELPKIGQVVKAADEIATLESVKAASDVYAPISGTITEINEVLQNNPALINQAPYHDGWLVKISPSNPEELQMLLGSDAYLDEINEE